jgi:uncharacterized cupin superfamily protein
MLYSIAIPVLIVAFLMTSKLIYGFTSSVVRISKSSKTHFPINSNFNRFITMSTSIVVGTPSPEEIIKMKRWSTWGCGVSKFPWSYSDQESAYIIKGRVIVTPTGGEGIEIKAGDFCVFPAGMSCTWDVKEDLQKHYNFD